MFYCHSCTLSLVTSSFVTIERHQQKNTIHYSVLRYYFVADVTWSTVTVVS